MSESRPAISIIIPSNRRPCLADAVAAVLANETKHAYEIIIAGELPDAPLPGDPAVTVVDAAGLGTGALRNLAVKRSAGDLLLFTDSDCVPDRDWIEKASASVSDTRPVVGGGIRFPEGNIWDLGDNLAIFRHLHVSRPPGPAGTLIGTNNLAVSRSVFEAVGGFRDDLTVGEDWEFLQRVEAEGYSLYFDPSFAVLHNSGRNRARDVRGHAEWYGRGYLELAAKGVVDTGPRRVDRLLRNVRGGAVCWSALKGLTHVLKVYGGHPYFLRYVRAMPAVWLFAYQRRKTIMQHWPGA